MPRVPIASYLNARVGGMPPGKALLVGAGVAAAIQVTWRLAVPGRLWLRLKLAVFRLGRTLLAPIVEKEIQKASKELGFYTLPGEEIHDTLPEKSRPSTEVIAEATKLHEELDADYSQGHLSGTVYHGGAQHTKLINDMMCLYQWSNPLHIDTFNAVRKMEAEVVKMVLAMFHGDTHRPDACGALTSGGTESICMALKSHRDWAAAELGIGPHDVPTVVAPVTAHPAFDKACQYYGLRLVKVPVDSNFGSVDAEELEKYITSSTILIVGSAPNYPFGTVDPIAKLGEIADSRGIGLHVDGCLGGFVTQFLDRVPGCADPPVCDFRCKGVTSISCDTHKFGYAPKGTSTVLYASKKLRRYQYFATGEWPGGLYASPAQAGSKAGNVIAGTWAAMLNFGVEGYADAATKIYNNLQKAIVGIRGIPHLRILGNPSVCCVAFTSDVLDIYNVSDRLCKKYGWKLNPLQFPAGIQFSLTLLHTGDGIMERFLKELNEIVVEMAAERKALGDGAPPIGVGGATMYGSQQKVADRSILCDVTKRFLDGYYETHHPVKKADEKK